MSKANAIFSPCPLHVYDMLHFLHGVSKCKCGGHPCCHSHRTPVFATHAPIALSHETNHRSWHNSWWVWTPRPQKAKLARWRWFPLHPQARKTASTVHVWSFLLNFAPVWSIVRLCVAISAESANSAIQSVHGWSHYLTLLTAPTAKATRSTSSSFEPVQTSSEKTPWNQCPKTKHDMIRMTAQRPRCWFRTMFKHKT